ncbi:MAG: hypothetical protein U5N58_08315 [Actinomycetota bacterium]|nr:hypothetical protein [Actinomycetota bacterium]
MKPEQDWWVFPGFEIKLVVEGLDLPVNIAVNHIKNNILLYVTELYGQVRVITKDYKVHTYAQELLITSPPRNSWQGRIRGYGNLHRTEFRRSFCVHAL